MWVNNRLTMDWYEIHRKDGTIQYAVKRGDAFFLNGSGFAIQEFDADKVVKIDGHPPTIYREGIVQLEGGFEYAGIEDQNQKWNGWSMPFILAKDIDRFIKDVNPQTEEYGVGNLFKLKGDKLHIEDVEYEEYNTVVEKTNILGKDCYYLGNIGWCFEFKTKN